MTETLHIHMAMMSVVLLLLTHLVIFIPMPQRTKVWLITATFVSALARGGGRLAGAIRQPRRSRP